MSDDSKRFTVVYRGDLDMYEAAELPAGKPVPPSVVVMTAEEAVREAARRNSGLNVQPT